MANPASLMETIVRRMANIRRDTGEGGTLLAVCPNSVNVIHAVFRSAGRHRAPVIFAVTLNQVDLDGGYTGMTHREFAEKVREAARAARFDGPVVMAMDHGGPWQKDLHRLEAWSLLQTMSAVKASMAAALDAGFRMIHVDPTLECHAGGEAGGAPIDRVVGRTVELLAHAEAHRRLRNLPPVAYEVGTEEVHGGLTDPRLLTQFLEKLHDGLEKRQLASVWPLFVVGNVGTDLHSTTFNSEAAKKLVRSAGRFGSVIKGHYTDFVSDPRSYPAAGMGGANVGPEFSLTEYRCLSDLCDLEAAWLKAGRIKNVSGLKQILDEDVVSSGRWKKWRHSREMDRRFHALSPERRAWLIGTGCRYIWEQPKVRAARERLYDNCRRNGIDAGERVIHRLERDMDKYYSAFRIEGLTDRFSPVLSS